MPTQEAVKDILGIKMDAENAFEESKRTVCFDKESLDHAQTKQAWVESLSVELKKIGKNAVTPEEKRKIERVMNLVNSALGFLRNAIGDYTEKKGRESQSLKLLEQKRKEKQQQLERSKQLMADKSARRK